MNLFAGIYERETRTVRLYTDNSLGPLARDSPCITIVFFFYQLDAQILYFNTFTMFLYMFRALLCSSSGGQIVLVQHLVLLLSLSDCSVHNLRDDSRPLVTCVLNSHPKRVTIPDAVLLKMSIIVYETCRGI